mgnify:CR=1 FL=1
MVKDVEFLYDLTYQDAHGETRVKQEIFKEIFKTIEKAEEFIVIDMFLLNGYTDDDDKYPNISKILTKKIIEQKEKAKEIIKQIAVLRVRANELRGKVKSLPLLARALTELGCTHGQGFFFARPLAPRAALDHWLSRSA